MSEDGTPGWAYDEDGYCVCCGNGHWKYHGFECELRNGLDAARLVANPNILAAARSRHPEAVRFTFTQKQWDEIMEETRLIVAAALTRGDTDAPV